MSEFVDMVFGVFLIYIVAAVSLSLVFIGVFVYMFKGIRRRR